MKFAKNAVVFVVFFVLCIWMYRATHDGFSWTFDGVSHTLTIQEVQK